MGKYIIGFVVGAGLVLAAVAVAASQVSAAVRVSCWNDGSVHIDPIPVGQ